MPRRHTLRLQSPRVRQRPSAIGAVVLALAAFVAACDEPSEKPYLTFAGGGFVFNYQVGEAYYGVVAKAGKKLPPGAVVEAHFENPAGGPAFVVTRSTASGRIDYAFRSPPLIGVKANRPYAVELRIVDRQSREVLARYQRSFQSSLDQSVLPTVTRPPRQGGKK